MQKCHYATLKQKDETKDKGKQQDGSHLGPRMDSWKRSSPLAILITGETQNTASRPLLIIIISDKEILTIKASYIFFFYKELRSRLPLFSKRNRKIKPRLSKFQPERAITALSNLHSFIFLTCCNICHLSHALTSTEIGDTIFTIQENKSVLWSINKPYLSLLRHLGKDSPRTKMPFCL